MVGESHTGPIQKSSKDRGQTLKQARLELREEEAENLENAENMGIQVYRLSQERETFGK